MATDYMDKPRSSAAGTAAERLRRVAEEAREAAEHQRDLAETQRQAAERLRESAETARTIAERTRVAAEAVRHDAMTAVQALAESLRLTLEHMKALEQLRRALRDTPDPLLPDAN